MFWIASNGSVHAAHCVHAARVKVLFDAPTLVLAKKWGAEEFDRAVKVAPCAKSVAGASTL